MSKHGHYLIVCQTLFPFDKYRCDSMKSSVAFHTSFSYLSKKYVGLSVSVFLYVIGKTNSNRTFDHTPGRSTCTSLVSGFHLGDWAMQMACLNLYQESSTCLVRIKNNDHLIVVLGFGASAAVLFFFFKLIWTTKHFNVHHSHIVKQFLPSLIKTDCASQTRYTNVRSFIRINNSTHKLNFVISCFFFSPYLYFLNGRETF